MTPEQYVESGKHLPPFLQDFHDQKDFFKTMYRLQKPFEYYDEKLSWVGAQVFVIDFLLWFLAKRGWTLQRSRANVEFRDIQEEIKAVKEEAAEAFRQALAERSHPNE